MQMQFQKASNLKEGRWWITRSTRWVTRSLFEQLQFIEICAELTLFCPSTHKKYSINRKYPKIMNILPIWVIQITQSYVLDMCPKYFYFHVCIRWDILYFQYRFFQWRPVMGQNVMQKTLYKKLLFFGDENVYALQGDMNTFDSSKSFSEHCWNDMNWEMWNLDGFWRRFLQSMKFLAKIEIFM